MRVNRMACATNDLVETLLEPNQFDILKEYR